MDFKVDDLLLTTLSVKLVMQYNKTIQAYVNLSIFFFPPKKYVFQYPLETYRMFHITHNGINRCVYLMVNQSIV